MPQWIMANPAALLSFGVFVGIFSGLMGLGGGAVIIPVLVLLFGFTQTEAHGTSLAMILSPTQVPAILRYHQGGHIDWRLVLWVLPGMLGGSYVGAWIATSIDASSLKLVFGFVLIYVAGYTIFGGKNDPKQGAILAAVLVVLAVVLFAGMRWYGNQSVARAAQHRSASAQ